MSEDILGRRAGGSTVALTLTRSSARNALNRRLLMRLRDELDAVATSSKVRSVVLTGDGPVFCAGMDLKEAAADAESVDADALAVESMQRLADVIARIRDLPQPVIAAVQGDALGGGAGLAAACDLVVASSNARFGYVEVLRGLVPILLMDDLIAAVGRRRAGRMLLTGESIKAEVAAAWGLVDETVESADVLDRAMRIGRDCAMAAPNALAAVKRHLRHSEARPADLHAAAALGASFRDGDEAREGVLAFREKRPPRWAT